VRFDVISLFPSFFEGPLRASILGRAIERGYIQVGLFDLRTLGEGPRKKVDERPCGGGPGMVMMPGPLVQAIETLRKEGSRVVCFSPQGKPLRSEDCERLSKIEHLVLVCGHYEGIDQRVIDHYVDEEISIGDFVMTSGMPAAVCMIDAIARFVPGVLGDELSSQMDTFQNGNFEGPQYTRPIEFRGYQVPEILLGGHHQEIAAWRSKKGLEKMGKIRPDLIDFGATRSNSL